MKQTYQISEFHMEWFKEYIEKMNKKATKLGQKEVTYTVVGEYFDEIEVKVEVEFGRYKSHNVVTKIYDVEVEAEPIGLGGYKFVASIEHGYENGNIVHKVEDIELPKHYHTVDGICEHCNTNRRRKITVVLQGEDGQFIQIGRSCLKDFIGYDVENKLKWTELLNTIEDAIRISCGGGGASYVPYINLAEYLVFVEKEIDENGWASKSNVDRVEDSTSYKAESRMISWLTQHGKDEKIEPSEFVQQAIEWIRTTEDTSREYMMNLQIMCKGDYVRVKDMGYVASLLATYKKHLDYLRSQELKSRAKGNSVHVGIIGKRQDFELTLERYTSFDSMYGTTWIYIFRDSNGNCLVWKSSKCIDTKEGETVKMKGTIKEHGCYNGEKQTILTRCKIEG